MSQQAPNQPVRVIRAANIRAVVWENIVQWGGRTEVRYSVQAWKSLHDRQTGRPRDTNCFLADDLPAVILVLQKAHRFCQARGRRKGGGGPPREPRPYPAQEAAQAAESESPAARESFVEDLDETAEASEG